MSDCADLTAEEWEHLQRMLSRAPRAFPRLVELLRSHREQDAALTDEERNHYRDKFHELTAENASLRERLEAAERLLANARAESKYLAEVDAEGRRQKERAEKAERECGELRGKAAIAEQLAWRDKQIAELQQALAGARDQVRDHQEEELFRQDWPR